MFFFLFSTINFIKMAVNSEKIKKTMKNINESLKSTQQSESEKLELEWKNLI